MSRNRFVVLLVVLLLSLATGITVAFAAGTDAPTRLTLGVIPSQESGKMMESMQPLADLLSAKLGIPVKAATTTSYTGLIEAMRTGKVDVAIMGAFAVVLAEEQADARIMLGTIRNGALEYRAQFITAQNSNIRSIKDLKGKTFAFADPASTSGYLYPYMAMRDAGLNPDKDLRTLFAGTHDAAVIAVLNGDVDAAATYEDARTAVKAEYPNVMSKVRVFAYSDPIPNGAVMVRQGLSASFTTELKQALLQVSKTPQGQQALKDLWDITGLADTSNSAYDVVRRTYQELRDKIRL